MAARGAKFQGGLTIDDAVRAYQTGDLERAEAAARAVLAGDPASADAHQLRGVIAYRRGNYAAACESLVKAIHERPDVAEYYSNLGAALRLAGRLAEGEQAHRRAIALDPNNATARANLANVMRVERRFVEAEEAYRAALQIDPARAEVWRSLAQTLQDQGKFAEAEIAFRNAIDKEPGNFEIWNDLGVLLMAMERNAESFDAYQKAITLKPDYGIAQGNLSALLLRNGKMVMAEGAARRAHELQPYQYRWLANLGTALQGQCKFEAAEATFRKALAMRPNYVVGYGNLLFCRNYRPDLDAEAIAAEFRAFNEAIGKPLMPAEVRYDNDPDPERRLRVGYLSPDFRHHSVSYFSEPLISAHDKRAVELFLYAEVPLADEYTQRFKGYADHWRSTVGLDDEQLAALIRRDRIDVLVDLGGHTSSSRILVMARKVAPVQVAQMVGHGTTSGLSAIDAFLADEALVPPGAERYFAEEVIRLPRIPLAYRPPAGMPEPTAPPVLTNGHITFGCFSRLERINDRVIEVWARILERVPGSKLVLNSKPLTEKAYRERLIKRFARHGVTKDQLSLVYTSPQPKTWAAYGEIDIALDPFPHNAGTTTIEALWLGVPVVSILDRPPVGRFGASILGAVGLEDWVAADVDAYVDRAVEAATDIEALTELRAGLRARFLASPLADEPGLARTIEGAYRDLWRRWCATVSDAGALQRAAGSAHARGDRAGALAALERAAAIEPSATTWTNIGALRRALGRVAEAEAAYGEALALDPNHAEALANLSNVLVDQGRLVEAAEVLTRLVGLNPGDLARRVRLADIVFHIGRHETAVEIYRSALAIEPEHTVARRNLVVVLRAMERFDEAETVLRDHLSEHPDAVEEWISLANILDKREKRIAAEQCFRRAIEEAPQRADVMADLSDLLRRLGRPREAIEMAEAGIAIDRKLPALWNNLGNALRAAGRVPEAEAAYDGALAVDPDYAQALNNRGIVRMKRGRPVAAEADFRRAMALAPKLPEIGYNLGSVLQDQARLEEATQVYRAAIAAKPDQPDGHGSFLFCMNYRTGVTAEEVLTEFRRWDLMHARRFLPASPEYGNDREPNRRLRIAYVSPDFRAKSACFFIEPLLAAHDRASVELFLYAEVPEPDAITARFKALADHWRPTAGLTDDEVAAQIAKDRIDVVVDMGGHTSDNRLLALARKPAPVQVAYLLGHGATSGLAAMDAFLADRTLVPFGAEKAFSETVVRLDRIPLVYEPPATMPEVGPLPALANGHVTFGCFSRPVRINERVIAVWSRILNAVPGSRLVLNAMPFSEEENAEKFALRFAAHGIARHRLDLVYTYPQMKTWGAYGGIDIALDPFPHNAGTTTIEALWLGVPVLSLADRPPVGRFGAMILGAVGLSDWVAADEDAYVARAVAAAADLDGLAALRAGLRDRFRASPLMDGRGLAAAMEQAYRALFSAWAKPPTAAQATVSGAAIAFALFGRGDLDGAAKVAEGLVAANPDDAEALHVLGLVAFRKGDAGRAVDLVQRSATIAPVPGTFSNLGAILRAARRPAEAEAAYRAALKGDPNFADALANLGNLLMDRKDYAGAAEVLARAVAGSPDNREALRSLGLALISLDRHAEAEPHLRRAVLLETTGADAHEALAALLRHTGRPVEAEGYYRTALLRSGATHRTLSNYAVVLQDQGRFQEAEKAFRDALALRPDYVPGHANLLFCLNYRADLDAETIAAEFRRFDAAHGRPLMPATRMPIRDRDPDRRLKVGYLSPDFRAHSVAFFTEPMIAAHDRSKVEVFLYSEVYAADEYTRRFQALADHWRSTTGLDDAALAAMIARDEIDVLVDLGGHTSGSRILVMARQPAPVQVCQMVGLGTTSGLSAIDVFLADVALVPEGADALFAEKVVRLPRIPLAYKPPRLMPEVGPLPAATNGFVTFGCFSRVERINDEVVAAWSKILRAIPNARLVLNTKPFSEEAFRDRMRARFAANGVAAERLDLVFTTPQPATWDAYGGVDIALDPFPHNAGTTTIEALWLGVPVVSMKARPSVGRLGASILGAVGMADWVADDVTGYVARAVEAASDLDRLARLRAALRDRFRASPLADAEGLARLLEDTYRRLWRERL
ncbi:tetratricopeptide repeat protein [Methyloraptor flagellatus]|uniref:protein O-GlcNAc transferase n=1 Tax=Methyloraptor flagellatus TaxID=3162530 RepID=A0AAU7XAP1_9HYPH